MTLYDFAFDTKNTGVTGVATGASEAASSSGDLLAGVENFKQQKVCGRTAILS